MCVVVNFNVLIYNPPPKKTLKMYKVFKKGLNVFVEF